MQKTPTDLQKIELVGRDGETFDFLGKPLGVGSSQQDDHRHDVARDRYAPRGVRCSACRWFEVAIYRRYVTEGIDLKTDPKRPKIYQLDSPEPGDYVVHTIGASIVPGETRLSRITPTDSPFEVIELLTVRPRDGDQQPWIPAQSARALAHAAEFDDGLREAYVNRAVV